MALIGCGVAQSSICTACFPKMLKNQLRFHWHATKWQTIFVLLLWLQHSSLSFFISWPFPTAITSQHFKNCPNYVNSTDSISAFCSFLWPLKPSQPVITFSRQYVNAKSKELKMIKDSTQSFAGFHKAKEKRQFNCADKAWEDQSHCAATPSLHVDINLKESRLSSDMPEKQ